MENKYYVVNLNISGLPSYIRKPLSDFYTNYVNGSGKVWYPFNETDKIKSEFGQPEVEITDNIYNAVIFTNIDEQFMKSVCFWYPNAIMQEIKIVEVQ